MKYNWQQSDWGTFTFSLKEMEDTLYVFMEKAGHLKGLLRAMPKEPQEETLIEILVSEAIKTSEIENEYLSREDVTSSIRNNLGLFKPNKEVKDVRAKGLGKLMTEVRSTYNEPLSEETLKKWHQYLFVKNTKINVGNWRSHPGPMQVVSGRLDKPNVHFEAPPSAQVPQQIKAFVQWFNATAPNGANPIKYAPVRSAISHIYFESIHPFEDGNGRIGRAIADKALSQSVGYPLLLSLSATIERNKKAYYGALENAQKSNEITPWISYFAQVIINAQKSAEALIDFTLKKVRFFDTHKTKLNERQLKSIDRMFQEGPRGFEGGMTAKKYMRIVQTSKATATRDLRALERLSALLVRGSGRSTHYYLNLDN
ncbi:MAG: Fic family protein [Marinirhabdus sp.]